MQQLIFFFQKYRYFLFFLLLQSIALALTINNHSFHKSKFVNSANSVTGGFYNKVNSFRNYFQLVDENKNLIQENTAQKNKIEQLIQLLDSTVEIQIIDTILYHQKYTYISGKVTKNQYASNYNFLTINLGSKDSILKEMAVVNSKGIIGITENVTSNYARVQSILNKDSKTNARLKNNSDHFGTLEWDGKNYNNVQLIGIPRQAIIQTGDTIITGGRSSIFPEGIPIGTVIDVQGGSSITKVVNIKLFNDMSNISNIYVVKNFDKKEIETLENNSNE